MCQYCKKGYYDANKVDRIKKIRKLNNYDNIRLNVDCKPCNCHKEGSLSYICNQEPKWVKKADPYKILHKNGALDNQEIYGAIERIKMLSIVEKSGSHGHSHGLVKHKDKDHHEDEDHDIDFQLTKNDVEEAGTCTCRYGYRGTQCDICNHEQGLVEPGTQLKTWWQRKKEVFGIQDETKICVERACDFQHILDLATGKDTSANHFRNRNKRSAKPYAKPYASAKSWAASFPSSYAWTDPMTGEVTNVDVHQSCRHKDTLAHCQDGNCMCTERFYGKYCENKASSGLSTRFEVLVVLFNLFLLHVFMLL